jgi:Heat induced stress protein YflT domain
MSFPNEFRNTNRRVVASFDRYEDAEAFVDQMADDGLPVERVTILGRDVRIVERITGHLNAVRAALYGALYGAFLGSLLGLLFGLIFADDGGELLATWLYWLIAGALFATIFALVAYAMMGGRRNFTSVGGITASHYDILIDESVADQAERWLAERLTERGESRRV